MECWRVYEKNMSQFWEQKAWFSAASCRWMGGQVWNSCDQATVYSHLWVYCLVLFLFWKGSLWNPQIYNVSALVWRLAVDSELFMVECQYISSLHWLLYSTHPVFTDMMPPLEPQRGRLCTSEERLSAALEFFAISSQYISCANWGWRWTDRHTKIWEGAEQGVFVFHFWKYCLELLALWSWTRQPWYDSISQDIWKSCTVIVNETRFASIHPCACVAVLKL